MDNHSSSIGRDSSKVRGIGIGVGVGIRDTEDTHTHTPRPVYIHSSRGRGDTWPYTSGLLGFTSNIISYSSKGRQCLCIYKRIIE